MSAFTERLRGLQKPSTPVPWRKQRNKLARVSSEECEVARCGDTNDKELEKFCSERWNADAALIAEAVSALPAILEVLEADGALLDAIALLKEAGSSMEKYETEKVVDVAWNRAYAAQSALNALVEILPLSTTRG